MQTPKSEAPALHAQHAFILHVVPPIETSQINLQPQALLHISPHDFLIFISPLPPHPCRVHIRWTLIVRLRQHAHNAYQDLLNTLYGRPAL